MTDSGTSTGECTVASSSTVEECDQLDEGQHRL